MSMNFTVEKLDNYTLIRVTAEKLDNTISPMLKSQLVVLSSEGVRNIVIDLEIPRYCDSSGLSAILVANRLCNNADGVFVLTQIQEPIRKLISISQLDSILNITDTTRDAVDLISLAGAEKENKKQ
jgi:anti-sigma B factor antagonist